MNPNASPSRATEVWLRFAGLYGADRVERKYGKTAPPEWQAMLARLNNFEIDRALRRLAYGAQADVPTLPQFTKLARTVHHDDWDEPQPVSTPQLERQYHGDAWEIRANLWLLNFITTQQQLGVLYCGATHEETAALTQPLVDCKKAWAVDMREAQAEMSEVPIEYQTRHWRADVALAEEQIARVRARYAQRQAA